MLVNCTGGFAKMQAQSEKRDPNKRRYAAGCHACTLLDYDMEQ